jgi:histidinol-phosphate aminotransferase
MTSCWKNNLRKIDPYVPGEQPDFPDMIKLNTNENPFPPSPEVLKALQIFDTDTLRLYPDLDSMALKQALAQRYSLSKNQIFLGVGSDDVLATAFMTFFHSGKSILFPDITYSFYDVWAELFHVPYQRPALDDTFHIKASDYYPENGGVVLANPNAPTGIYQNEAFLRDVIEHNQDVVVIIDEAYADFSGHSALNLTKEYDNVLVVQTFSKSRAMAGMRIGYAMGNSELIQAMQDIAFSYNSYPMTRLSVSLGAASVKDEEYFQKCVAQIIEIREWTKQKLRSLDFSFPDSQTNFIFAKHQKVAAEEIFEKLRERHIFVRHFHALRIEDYLRITIGTKEQMQILMSALEEILR